MSTVMRIIVVSVLILFAGVKAQSQTFVPQSDNTKPTAFDKKIVWGFTFTQSWSTISGSSLPKTYFTKPSVGLLASIEYFPKKFIGFSAGFGFQQRGAGVQNTPTPGVPDSTYRERLRFSTFELPISIIVRTPKDIIKGMRLSASAGIAPVFMYAAYDTKISVEPNIANLDNSKDVSGSYFKNDLAFQFTAGSEIDMASKQVIRIHFYYSQGTTNVYSSGTGQGHNQNIGIRLGWMF
jgi:hypothetical protein